jgi:methylated-DNA-[protein]-cysteine S-methyltransferase
VSNSYWAVIPSPVDDLLAVSDGVALTGLGFAPPGRRRREPTGLSRDDDLAPFQRTRDQLGEYFAGGRRAFDVPLALSGSPFQLRVWQALREIPYGTTCSYGDLAARLGLPPGASRAVGLANGANPVPIIVPCHRVIGADGSLTGFGGGLARKRFLLDVEADLLF